MNHSFQCKQLKLSRWSLQLVLVTGLLFAFSACRKDINDFIRDPQARTFQVNIGGTVVNETGSPVVDAKVTYEGVETLTDKNGVYRFSKVKVNSLHNLIRIEKNGYFEGSRVFTTDRETSITLRNILLAKSFDNLFDAGSGGTIQSGNLSLIFPADGIVTDAGKQPYSGIVKVAVKYLDPSNIEMYAQMPGNLVGLDETGNVVTLNSLGMAAVELQSTSGEKLQVATGTLVTMKAKVPASMIANSPSTVPMWSFDEVRGYWLKEGEAILEGDTYTTSVTHFSFWNYDSQRPSIILSGRVIDENGNPIANVHVGIKVPGDPSGGHGYTNADGTFSGRVASNEILEITIRMGGACNHQIMYQEQIGPFSTDVSIPDIVVPPSNTAINYTISGLAINCNGMPVTNGYVKITRSNSDIFPLIFEIVNGSFSGHLMACSNTQTISVIVVDSEALEAGDPVFVTLNHNQTNVDLGTIDACGNLVDFFTITATSGTTYDLTVLGSLNLQYQTYKFLSAHSDSLGNPNGGDLNVFNLIWSDDVPHQVATGTFELLTGDTFVKYVQTGVFYEYNLIDGTVTITDGGGTGSTILGNYTMNMEEIHSNNLVTFTGTFRKKL